MMLLPVDYFRVIIFFLLMNVQEGGGVSRVNIGRLITTSVTSRHTSMFFKMAGNFLVRHFCKR